MSDITSILKLEHLVFDSIDFKRFGFKNENEVSFILETKFGKNKNDSSRYQVVLNLKSSKQDEYEIHIQLTGYFQIEKRSEVDSDLENDLIKNNAVAILMPFLRSELTLITAQPETDSIVLPVINVNKLLEEHDDN